MSPHFFLHTSVSYVAITLNIRYAHIIFMGKKAALALIVFMAFWIILVFYLMGTPLVPSTGGPITNVLLINNTDDACRYMLEQNLGGLSWKGWWCVKNIYGFVQQGTGKLYSCICYKAG